MEKLSLTICILFFTTIIISAQQKNYPKLTGSYLGQKPPIEKSIRFAEKIITNNFYPHSKLIISPNNDRIYWTSFIDTVGSNFALYYSDFDGTKLSVAKKDTTVSKYGILHFIYSNDGSNIFFGSHLPYDKLENKLILYGFVKSQRSARVNPNLLRALLIQTGLRLVLFLSIKQAIYTL